MMIRCVSLVWVSGLFLLCVLWWGVRLVVTFVKSYFDYSVHVLFVFWFGVGGWGVFYPLYVVVVCHANARCVWSFWTLATSSYQRQDSFWIAWTFWLYTNAETDYPVFFGVVTNAGIGNPVFLVTCYQCRGFVIPSLFGPTPGFCYTRSFWFLLYVDMLLVFDVLNCVLIDWIVC